MADHNQTTRVILQEIAQPNYRVGIKVVSWLVEDHGLSI